MARYASIPGLQIHVPDSNFGRREIDWGFFSEWVAQMHAYAQQMEEPIQKLTSWVRLNCPVAVRVDTTYYFIHGVGPTCRVATLPKFRSDDDRYRAWARDLVGMVMGEKFVAQWDNPQEEEKVLTFVDRS